MAQDTIWLRHEDRATERRTPLLPEGAKNLIGLGYNLIVEKSAKRIIADEHYQAVGCQMVTANSWKTAPREAIILGLKELPEDPALLRNTHIYFAHAYKAQNGWERLLSRFMHGGGGLLDIEYLVKRDGKRVVAFGYFAGYMGAALALIHWNNKQSGQGYSLDHGLTPFDNAHILNDVIKMSDQSGKKPKVLIIGAHGRCGIGTKEILEQHGAKVTCWGRKETRHIDREALLSHDIMINCAFTMGDVPAFLRKEDLNDQARLSVIADVSCDPFSAFNPIPLYHDTTSWEKPYITVDGTGKHKAIDIIAIDNLPSLLPRESSQEFARQLLPYLKTLHVRDRDPVWSAARQSYENAIAAIGHKEAS